MNMTDSIHIPRSKTGAIALPVILMLASMILAIGLAINYSSNNKIETSKNNENALNALYIAESGVQDASEKISRNKNFNGNYTLTVSAGSATITVINSLPTVTIESKGSYSGNFKTVKATLNVDNDGKIATSTLREEL